ncbi:MAG: IS66 family insertion sequence element accessory protein TnpB [Gammaproteobacteria bacterium]|nr:IS66 family insertion sequence element accessory protein TnpB [Gammaproteobacteria bacterium]
MRKSFDGLSGIVTNHLQQNPMHTGRVYLFINKRRDKIKLLHYESGGFVLYYKRLEAGGFSYAKQDGIQAGRSVLSWAEVAVLMQGLSLSKVVHKQVRNPRKIVGK